jgi:hypothetical protein
MLKKLGVIVFLIFITGCTAFSQGSKSFINTERIKDNKSSKLELSDKILNFSEKMIPESSLQNKISFADDKKSPGIAIILSLILPGAGHFYEGRMDVGKYFVTGEVLSWLGLIGINMYGNSLRNDSRTFAAVHSGLNKAGKDDNYFSNVGNFNTIYDYNNDVIRKGEYDKIYDIGSYFWSWDSFDSRAFFETQRKHSERVYNSRVIFGSILVVNRLISALSSLILINNNTGNSSSLNINTEAISTQNNLYDGIRLNLLKSF